MPFFFIELESTGNKSLRYKSVMKFKEELELHFFTSFKVIEVELTIDFITPDDNGMIDLLNKRINLGKLWTQFEHTFDYNEFSSEAYQIQFEDRSSDLLLDKKALWTINIIIYPRMLQKSLSSIEQIGFENWTWTYGKLGFFWFHYHSDLLIKRMGEDATIKSMWFARKYMYNNHKVLPSQFYDDYLREHPDLSELVRVALHRFRWNPDEV